MPEDQLSIVVQHADGRTTRWGPEEVDGRNIPTDLSFETGINEAAHGFGPGSCSLLRRLDQQYPDQDLFDLVTVIGAGGRIAHQGFAYQFPRSHADTYAITPGWVGPAVALRWDPSFREIYADRGFNPWTEATLDRRVALGAGSVPQGKVPVQIGNGGIAWMPPNEALPNTETTEILYDAGAGLAPAIFGYRGSTSGSFASFEAATIFNGTDSANPTNNMGTLTLDNTTRSVTLSTPRRYLMMRTRTSAGVTPPVGTTRTFDQIAVYGDHGLTTRAISGEPDGLYGSDIVADVVSRCAPMLSTGGIEATVFVIPHVVYRDATTAEFVVSDVNKYHLYDWGVYDDLEFFFRRPDPDRLCWEARFGDGAHMDADGLTGEQVNAWVSVAFTDPTGVARTAGPPSDTAGSFDYTDASLRDDSAVNAANTHGFTVKGTTLSLSFPTTQAGAVQIGVVYLAERQLATRRGRVTLTGTVNHPTEGKVPVWRVRAGDWIRVTDLDGENASAQRKIVHTSYSHASRSITLDLDNTPAQLDAIMARVGIKTGIAVGGGF